MINHIHMDEIFRKEIFRRYKNILDNKSYYDVVFDVGDVGRESYSIYSVPFKKDINEKSTFTKEQQEAIQNAYKQMTFMQTTVDKDFFNVPSLKGAEIHISEDDGFIKRLIAGDRDSLDYFNRHSEKLGGYSSMTPRLYIAWPKTPTPTHYAYIEEHKQTPKNNPYGPLDDFLATSPFRFRRRGSNSVKRRRKLRSKSKSRKRSPKPRRR